MSPSAPVPARSTAVDRRTFLRWSAVASGAVATSAGFGGVWAQPASAASPVRVILLVIDGLRPDELRLMTNVSALAAAGTHYTGGRAQMLAETTPNHVSMITGVRVDRHGLPGNGVPFLEDNIGLQPRYLQADSIFTLAHLQAPALRTAEVGSKTYIVAVNKHDRSGDGVVDADATYTPTVVVPGADFTPDAETMKAGIEVSRRLDPDFLFLSLGDTDRVGHLDETGAATSVLPTGSAPLGRTTTLQNTDALVGQFVADLKARKVWGSTVLLITADHSMDWSLPGSTVSLSAGIEADRLLRGQVLFALNGGAALYALRQPAAATAPEALRRLRAIALSTDGVDEAHYIRPNPADGGTLNWVGSVRPDWGLTGDHTGDLVVTVRKGYRIVGDSPFDNPIPGNHGHVVTLPVPVVISGGAPIVKKQRIDPPLLTGPADRAPGQPENIDMAVTAAWLLGLRPPAGGFDGRVLTEAFTERPPARVAAAAVASMPVFTRLAGADRPQTSVLLSARAFPSGAPAVVIASATVVDDALAAAPLAAQLGAPVLLSASAGLSAAVVAEVRRLRPQSAVVMGGTGVLSERVVADLVTAGVPATGVRRIAGADRFETAARVARELDTRTDVVLVGGTPGPWAFASALAAGPVAGRDRRPVLLTSPDALPAATAAALGELGVQRVLLAGGTKAVGAGVATALQQRSLRLERLGGDDPYAVGALLTERAIREGAITDTLYLVSGEEFPLALAAASALLADGGLLLGVPPRGLTAAGQDFLSRRADLFTEIVLVGGTGSLTAKLEQQVRELVRQRRTRTS